MDNHNVPRQLYPHTGFIGVRSIFGIPLKFFGFCTKKKKAVKIRVAININVCAIIQLSMLCIYYDNLMRISHFLISLMRKRDDRAKSLLGANQSEASNLGGE